MKAKSNLASILLAGTMLLAGCSKRENKNVQEDFQPSRTIVVLTAKNVEIKPHYGADPTLMDGISMAKFVHVYDHPNISDVKVSEMYAKGSPEYEALRPLLTVERTK